MRTSWMMSTAVLGLGGCLQQLPECAETVPDECPLIEAEPVRADNCFDIVATVEPGVTDLGEGTLEHGGNSACGDGGVTFVDSSGQRHHLVFRAQDAPFPEWEEPLVVGDDGGTASLQVEADDEGRILGATVLNRFDELVVTNRALGDYISWNRGVGIRCPDCALSTEDRTAIWEDVVFAFGAEEVAPRTELQFGGSSGRVTFRNIRARVWNTTPVCAEPCEQPWEWLLYSS